jgi:transposase
LTKTRWLLPKRPDNLTDKQETKLAELLRYNLKLIRGYLPKEKFQPFWSYTSPYWAGQFLDKLSQVTDITDLRSVIKVDIRIDGWISIA